MLSKLNPSSVRAAARAIQASTRSTGARLPAMRAAPNAGLRVPQRAFGWWSSTPAAQKKPDMFCFQCEQTKDQTGCTTVGVCGKTAETAALQDALVHVIKGACVALQGKATAHESELLMEALFSTLTNVNFDSARIVDYINQVDAIRWKALGANKAAKQLPAIATAPLPAQRDVPTLETWGKNAASIFDRKAKLGDDIVGLQEMIVYGVKGAAAYASHAKMLGKSDANVDAGLLNALAYAADEKPTVDGLLGTALGVGELNLRVLALLDGAHSAALGVPSPQSVSTRPKPGKCILISGHDMTDLEHLLKQTEGKGINVYTHGEMLPAHGYPKLRAYKHLAGHYGGPWQLQKFEFSQFPGSILMTSNCIVEPKPSYRSRIFTTHAVGFPGVTHVADKYNFAPVIESALKAPGFTAEDCAEYPDKSLLVGFGHKAVLGVADKVIAAVKGGAIKRFFVVGGCDGSEGERSYFTDIVKAAPKESVILTIGCGKYRFNKLDLGDIGGIPRVLDMGQCNDSYGAVVVALELAKAFGTDVNGLPLSFAISWFEQKAVAVLLTLLHLGVRNIHLGPHLPGFATKNMVSILSQKFNLQQINHANVAEDMKLMMAGK